MTRFSIPSIPSLLLGVSGTLLLVPAAALAGPAYFVDIVPVNDQNVTGRVDFTFNDALTELTVNVTASGLVANQAHAQHIHGFPMNEAKNAVLPPPSAAGNDGLIQVSEGAPFYGEIILPLAPFPMASATGAVSFSHTYDDAAIAALTNYETINTVAKLMPLENKVYVIHGVMVDGLYNPQLPAAGGQIEPVPGTGAGTGGGTGTGGPAVVPLPNSAFAGLATLGLIGGVGFARRRRATA